MISGRSIMLSGYNIMESATKMCDNISCPLDVSEAGLAVTPPTTTSVPAYIYMEKVRNERLASRIASAQIDSLKEVIMESSPTELAATSADLNIRVSDNNNNNNHISRYNSSNCSLNYDKNGNMNTSCNRSNNTNNDRNCHDRKGIVIGQQVSQTGQNLHSTINNNTYTSLLSSNPISLHLASKYMKIERSSPDTNGDLQSTLPRSRSSTPSSFHDTSPQQSIHSSPSNIILPTHNLPTNLLNSIHQATTPASRTSGIANLPTATMVSNSILQQPSEPLVRNYSDFMRNLAAKYNNSISNDPKHNAILESSPKLPMNKRSSPDKAIPESSITSALNAASIALSKPLIRTVAHSPSQSLPDTVLSPIESITVKQSESSQTNSTNTPAIDANFSPFITTFLSNLPFHQNYCSPLIDMSSTQALITLARVAKENEVQNVLRCVQNFKRTTETPVSNITFKHNVNVALQQAMQFATPSLIYSTQTHELNSQHSSPSLAHSFDSTMNVNSSQIADETMSSKIVANQSIINLMPLDLSSQPPLSKRLKTDLTINQSKNLSSIKSMTDRRVFASTSSTLSPPLTQKLRKPLLGSRISSSSAAAAFTLPVQIQNLTPNSATITATTITTTTASTPEMIGNVCHAQSEEVNSWSVEDVCSFVGNIDICAEYIQHFRDQLIDGSGLPLLTEDHLINTLGLKLGPALKLRSALAKKLGGLCPCVACMSQAQHVQPAPSNEALITIPVKQITSPIKPTSTPIDTATAAEDIIDHSGNMTNSSIANTSTSHFDDNDDTKSSTDAATALQCNEVSNNLHHLSNNSNNNNSNHNVICDSGNGVNSGDIVNVTVAGIYRREYDSSGSSNSSNGNISNCNSANLSPKHNDFSNSTVSNNHNNKRRNSSYNS